MRFAFIDVEKTSYPMRILCRVLKVSASGYYAWRSRKPSRRDLDDERLRPKVVDAFKAGRGTYGSPRVLVELVEQGLEVGRRRVARLMGELGLRGLSPRKFRVTTNSDHEHPIAENVLARNFEASGPNEKWTTDITYVWTAEGWLYLAVVMDLYSRRIVGWATADHLETSLCLDALAMALRRVHRDFLQLHPKAFDDRERESSSVRRSGSDQEGLRRLTKRVSTFLEQGHLGENPVVCPCSLPAH
jgi:putative transposase